MTSPTFHRPSRLSHYKKLTRAHFGIVKTSLRLYFVFTIDVVLVFLLR